MSVISYSVGHAGINDRNDVRTVQRLLQRHGAAHLKDDGIAGPLTIGAIRRFQQHRLRMARPDGVIDPRGPTLRALSGQGAATSRRAAPVSGRQPPVARASGSRSATQMSGTAWWHANQARYPNSQSVDDLVSPFRENAQKFIAALRAAGASVRVSATRRNRIRAHLMHYCWKVAKGQIAAADVPAIDGCDIVWDHGSVEASRAAAEEMRRLFAIVFKPSLTSNHIAGTAIDMTIDYGAPMTIVDASGASVEVRSADALHRVGAGYGVRKLASDPPHWSANGR